MHGSLLAVPEELVVVLERVWKSVSVFYVVNALKLATDKEPRNELHCIGDCVSAMKLHLW